MRIDFKRVRNKSGGTILKACMGISMLICLLVPVSTAFAYTDSAHTSQSSATANADDTAACKDDGSKVHCIAPAMTPKTNTVDTGNCKAPQYYGPVSDGKTQIDWTYTYGSQHCVTVTWDTSKLNLDNDQCHANMYIPAHEATANITYHFDPGPNNVATHTVDQRSKTNGVFVDLGTVQKTLKSISFQDNFGTKHSAMIGWGTDKAYSLKITCGSGQAKASSQSAVPVPAHQPAPCTAPTIDALNGGKNLGHDNVKISEGTGTYKGTYTAVVQRDGASGCATFTFSKTDKAKLTDITMAVKDLKGDSHPVFIKFKIQDSNGFFNDNNQRLRQNDHDHYGSSAVAWSGLSYTNKYLGSNDWSAKEYNITGVQVVVCVNIQGSGDACTASSTIKP